MAGKRVTGGHYDFVDDDEKQMDILKKKLGKHVKMGGRGKGYSSPMSQGAGTSSRTWFSEYKKPKDAWFESAPSPSGTRAGVYKKSRQGPSLKLIAILVVLALGIYFVYAMLPDLMQSIENIEPIENIELLENISNTIACPAGYEMQEEKCISVYLMGAEEKEFEYLLHGKKDKISFVVYRKLDSYFSEKPNEYYCPPDCSQDDIEFKIINEDQQSKELDKLIELIQNKTDKKDDAARVAISLVQKIPYDWDGLWGTPAGRHPYEVLYDNEGICGEKSKLLAYLLRGLGYGVNLINYPDHQAVGVKCPKEYSLNDTGYCFIESTRPTILTDAEGEYVTVGKLGNPESTLKISEGASFESIEEEYEDAKEWNRINEISERSGGVLSGPNYNLWNKLVHKYGIELS